MPYTYNVLQYMAMCCSCRVLQCFALISREIVNSNNAEFISSFRIPRPRTHCNTLQHCATHCNTLQHTATHYSSHHLVQHTPFQSAFLQKFESDSNFISSVVIFKLFSTAVISPLSTPISTEFFLIIFLHIHINTRTHIYVCTYT